MSGPPKMEGARGERPGGTLYVCGTPIGNLEDISQRALRVLREVHCIAAEDTRHTRKLLSAYEIKTPLVSLHEHNEEQRTPELVALLRSGHDVALVSDAGMPGISDPGAKLVAACIAVGISVVPVPGPTAFVAALVASGLPTDRFAFEGFLPRRPAERRQRLEELAGERRTLVFYEAPHRLVDTLREMLGVWGDRRVAVARELTKLHEEFVRGSLSDVIARFADTAPRGEFVIVVEGNRAEPGSRSADDEAVRARLLALLEEGRSLRDAARTVAAEFGLPRGRVYQEALRLKGS